MWPPPGTIDQLRAGDLLRQVAAVFERGHAIGIAADNPGGRRDVRYIRQTVETVAGEEIVVDDLRGNRT